MLDQCEEAAIIAMFLRGKIWERPTVPGKPKKPDRAKHELPR
jgi:hypothetical protein